MNFARFLLDLIPQFCYYKIYTYAIKCPCEGDKQVQQKERIRLKMSMWLRDERQLWFWGAIVGMLSMIWLGCGAENESLLQIQTNPQEYAMQTEPLRVQGKVIESLMLSDSQTVFKIEDGSGGYLWVKSAQNYETDDTYEGVGKIKIGLSVMNRSYGILFIERSNEVEEQIAEGGMQ